MNFFGTVVVLSVNLRGGRSRGLAPRLMNFAEVPKYVCCHHSPVDVTFQLSSRRAAPGAAGEWTE